MPDRLYDIAAEERIVSGLDRFWGVAKGLSIGFGA